MHHLPHIAANSTSHSEKMSPSQGQLIANAIFAVDGYCSNHAFDASGKSKRSSLPIESPRSSEINQSLASASDSSRINISRFLLRYSSLLGFHTTHVLATLLCPYVLV